ncbi:MdtA/MuxA family multidrug efflux RND transporter periplasmic adaptor subunit [Azoarcus sp. TTM-91]|uniref:MdtA/MuxA family multidrug efflux RND transporter periplasmic adaptor subunit n=1 Tax=Azoarcus sp. TTM-91 TaxID=2691581 RepID=UPI00145F1100|nr:MdtA/MuxA family multidrug efflux RND transporter periplasmic adaptor subunit [Azoarcus sp. TTM-91]NMG34271.1 MdtA/MuxA family multidrug efflux RND transporter periplasmic adaptor subunit [Azoarcus sp. TTM-91]
MSRSASSSSSSLKRGVALGLGVLAIGGLAWFFMRGQGGAADQPAVNPWNAPVPVRVVPAEAGKLALRLRAIGTVTPMAAVTVRSRVDGELLKVAFEEGQMVQKGALLAEIDPSLYRVRLAQAEGQQLQNKAQLKNAESELARYQTLFAQDSIARQQVDTQEALVNQLRGTIKADQAQVDDARLQLQWTRIEAPIAGRLGLRRVDPGNLVSTGDTEGLVTITQMRPISVVFTIPEHQLGEVRQELRAGHALTVEARDRDDRLSLAQGVLRTVDNQIDVATGTVKLKAEFANGDEALFPNQFVNIRLDVRRVDAAVTIPLDAVQFGSKGSYVYVISEGKAHIRPLKLGAGDGDRVVVEQGLQAGEQVVLEGLDRLRDGRQVIVVEADAAAPGLPGHGAPAAAAGG